MTPDPHADPSPSQEFFAPVDPTEEESAPPSLNGAAPPVEGLSPSAASILAASRNAQLAIAASRLPRRVPPGSLFGLMAIAVLILGLALDLDWLTWPATLVSLLISLRLLWPLFSDILEELVKPQQRTFLVGSLGLTLGFVGLCRLLGWDRPIAAWFKTINWDVVAVLSDFIGAFGQILIAILAVYVAWRQYVISKDLTTQQNLLTIQQNLITQQQTIDTYFQGVSDLVLDEEGLLEDWPQERAIAEGRTAAILSSIDANGKAKVIRFLSQSKLLTPLKRDQRLGRAILDGVGGYAEDREQGVRVIDLGVMLAKADLSRTDLRWTDLSDANLVGADLSEADLVKANLARTILYGAKLRGADLRGARLFYGEPQTATPRSRTEPPNYATGECTGAVVEDADFSRVERLSEGQRYYICAWGGARTRATVVGGCEGIPNELGH